MVVSPIIKGKKVKLKIDLMKRLSERSQLIK